MLSQNDQEIAAVVLAAGKGTRMKSALPKVLHELLGQPLLGHVINLLGQINISRIIAVIGHGAENVSAYLSPFGIETVVQEEQLGTGHAVACAEAALKGFEGHVLIICGDTPLFLEQTLKLFVKQHLEMPNILSVLSARFVNPFGYGRIVRDAQGAFLGIVEEKDADQKTRQINEVNTGTYLVQASFLFSVLSGLDNDNAQQEYYLTDIVEPAVAQGKRTDAFCLASEEEALGVNSRAQLSQAETIMLGRIRQDLMDAGVTLQNASSVYVEPSVSIENDVLIEPGCVLKGKTHIASGTRIGAHSYLVNAEIKEGGHIPPFSCIME